MINVRAWLRTGLVGATCVATAWAADPAASAPKSPPVPPPPVLTVRPLAPRAPRPAAAVPPANPVTVIPATPLTGANPAVARQTTQPARPASSTMPLSDPTYIPGLTPIPSVGPPVPLAPQQPGRVFSSPLPTPVQETVFAYDALVKETALKPGEVSAHFTFNLTNTSPKEVTINAVRTSCGCTVAKLPAVPWKLPAGAAGSFDVSVDVRGKSGVLTKTVTVDSTAGYRYLTVRVSIPTSASPMAAADRARNLQVALADRQAVFKGDCMACHLQPAIGHRGETLYKNACGVCHEAEHRASMVPNLRALSKPTDREFWKNIIVKGKPETLMPAWAIKEGGPLTDDQIDSLVDYMTGPFKTQTATPSTAAAKPAPSAPEP